MYKKIAGLILLLMLTANAWSQTPINVMTVDQSTFELLQKKSWKQLLKEGNEAIQQGIDFYFLRVRMGIASYSQKNYHQAARHFEKARKFSDQEEYVAEYLYYAYYFGERTEEAWKLASTFSEALKKKTGTQGRPFIRELRLFYNTDFSDRKTTADNYLLNIDTLLNGTQYVANNNKYFHIAFTHDVGAGFSLSHGYSYINQHYFLYRQTDSNRVTTPDYTSNVHQYFASGQVRLARTWYLGLGLHYIGVRYPAPQAPTGYGPRWQREKTILTDHQVALFMHLKKNVPYVTVAGSFYYANLNSANQLQTDLIVNTYPLGNQNLYSSTRFSYQHETAGSGPIQRLVLYQELGGKICKHLWAEGFATYGTMQNYLSGYGTIVYNNANAIHAQLGARLILPINDRVQLRAEYTFSRYESVFNMTQTGTTTNNSINFNAHSITGGLIWNFSKPAEY